MVTNVTKEVALTLPFTVNAYGAVNSTTDQSKIWADRVRSVIGTNIRERVMRPDFGTRVPMSFMETQSEAEALISTETEIGFARYLPLLSLQSTEVTYDYDLGQINVTITYALPNGDVDTTTLAGIIYLQGNQPSIKENL